MITLINGNIQDGKGNLLDGSLVMQLTADATLVGSAGVVVSAIPLTFQVRAGQLLGSCKLYSNAELSPQTQYTVIFYDLNGSRTNNPVLWQFDQAAGSTVDIGTMTATTPGGPSVSFPFGKQTVTFASTVVFLGTTYNSFELTLTGNVSSSSFTGSVPGLYTFKFIQDATGGRTFAWPANFHNADVVDTTPNAISVQSFYFDGTNAYPAGPMTTN